MLPADMPLSELALKAIRDRVAAWANPNIRTEAEDRAHVEAARMAPEDRETLLRALLAERNRLCECHEELIKGDKESHRLLMESVRAKEKLAALSGDTFAISATITFRFSAAQRLVGLAARMHRLRATLPGLRAARAALQCERERKKSEPHPCWKYVHGETEEDFRGVWGDSDPDGWCSACTQREKAHLKYRAAIRSLAGLKGALWALAAKADHELAAAARGAS